MKEENNYQLIRAEEISKEFISFIKSTPEYQGKLISKTSIRIRYRISSSTATLLFTILSKHGFVNLSRTIQAPVFSTVPSPNPETVKTPS